MGNCQAAEAATVVIQHPGNKVERIFWSVSAREVMSSNPGHYVALVITTPTEGTHNGSPVRQLKLLRPGDTLLLGQVYRLISFEDVLKEFAAKKCVKLGKLLRESGGLVLDSKKISIDPSSVKAKPRLVNGIPPKDSVVFDPSRFGDAKWSMTLINMEAAVAAAVAREVWEDIMVVGNGNQPYRVLQRLELELSPTHCTISPTPISVHTFLARQSLFQNKKLAFSNVPTLV
ncbi:hypothetical protein RND71_033018 [Anisodus tanguticus]|uniref:Uncharacterized protein n=1 Tax=Anisodus tanguticus TaxID=243964 RepID=A0AAE1R710_9SOLA|nr:hypothetical protein RND71_033018 [Anisodus tanguticus]